ncbi:DUF6770 family protein [Aureivirga marina]|uniref:DUF6770 family protein n=1 Tax=Aureivirga marina TaxID=1182451 RepID=UPI0018CAB502|nr:DUF6770 family protein [Aureivirga marina]
MKKLLLLIVLMFSVLTSFGQTKTIEGVSEYKLIKSGTLDDKNNEVDGFYFFYKVDNLKKGKAEYVIVLLDKNLNEVARKKYIDDKKISLVDAAYNGDQISLIFINYKQKVIKTVGYNRKGELLEPYEFEVSEKDLKFISGMGKRFGLNQIIQIYPIDNKGYIISYMTLIKKMKYRMHYISTSGGKNWMFGEYKKDKLHRSMQVYGYNDKVIVFAEINRKSLMSKKTSHHLKVVNIDNGKVIFEKEFNKDSKNVEDLIMMTNASFTDEHIILMGEYYPDYKSTKKLKSDGLFLQKYTYAGEKISDERISWKDEIFSKFQELNNEKGKNFIFFHNIIKVDEGYIGIGEQYRKRASAGGIAAFALGGGSSADISNLVITDAFFFKFSENFELVDIVKFDKGKSKVPNIAGLSSPQIGALVAKARGDFDYVNTQKDSKNNRLYSTFIDYERLKGEKNKYSYKTIIYQDGEFKESKFYLSNKNKSIKAYPAKLGHVMIYEYDKKTKKSTLHLEKVEVE